MSKRKMVMDRANRVRALVEAYTKANGMEGRDLGEVIRDLITDLLLLADEEAYDVVTVYGMARFEFNKIYAEVEFGYEK